MLVFAITVYKLDLLWITKQKKSCLICVSTKYNLRYGLSDGPRYSSAKQVNVRLQNQDIRVVQRWLSQDPWEMSQSQTLECSKSEKRKS